MSVGENIKKYRKLYKLTQAELGDKIGKSPITIRQYESGHIDPPTKVIKEISNIFNVSISDLITDDKNKLNIEISDNDLNSLKHEDNFFFKTSEQDITLIYKKFIDTERRILIELIENINKIFCQSKYNTDALIRNNDFYYRDLSTLIENIITARLDYYQRLEHEKNNIIDKE